MRFPWSKTPGTAAAEIAEINRRRAGLALLDDERLRGIFRQSPSLLEIVAVVAVVASRVLSLEMFDVQLKGALALARGRIAEMQTGEGKTLAATPAVAWYARSGRGVHVMTVNDYLARRDAAWMGGGQSCPRPRFSRLFPDRAQCYCYAGAVNRAELWLIGLWAM